LVNDKLRKEGIVGGYELSKDYPELDQALLFCATEMLSKDDMDRVVEIIKQ
jgi:glycine dehydrogenase subunit 1